MAARSDQAVDLRRAGQRHHRLPAPRLPGRRGDVRGPPTEKNESDRVEWIPLADVRGMIDRREIVSSGSLVGLLYVLMDEAIR